MTNINIDPLIKKVSKAVGGIFEPWQIERVAKAKAKVEIIKANTKITINELQNRALERFAIEEGIKQNNMEAITQKALSDV